MKSFKKNIAFSVGSAKINLPLDFIRELMITEDDRKVSVYMQDNKIVIEKAN